MRSAVLTMAAAWAILAAIGVAAGAFQLGGAGHNALTWFVIALLALTLVMLFVGVRAVRTGSQRWNRGSFGVRAPHRSWFVLPLAVTASLQPPLILGAVGWAVLHQINSQRRWHLPATLIVSWTVAAMLISAAALAATALSLARR